MNRTLLIASVCLAAYGLLNVLLSAFAATVWKTRAVAPTDLPPDVRARRLFMFRLAPSVTAAIITITVVAPAFAIFEPAGHEEQLGPALIALTIAAAAQIALGIGIAARSMWLTARFERDWLRASTPMENAGGLRAFAIQSSMPIVALVGVFTPKLIAARSVIDACSPREIRRIIGHERGHLHSRDNLKRWLMAALPDALRWTSIHSEIVDAWHYAAEDAADDSATGGSPEERAELAALLLKIVRLAPEPAWDAAIVSPFVEYHGLERRVKRLLKPELEPPAPWAVIPLIAAATMAAAIAVALASPGALEAVFDAFEQLVALGR